jgi:hypothetical protein
MRLFTFANKATPRSIPVWKHDILKNPMCNKRISNGGERCIVMLQEYRGELV